MAPTRGTGIWVKVAKVAAAPIAGFVVIVLLLPIGWVQDPPMCQSVFGYRVPCGGGLSYGGGAVTAVAVGLAFWPWVNVAKVALSLMAGVVVFLLLFPASGVDTLPPTCWSVFDYEVPCNANLAYAAGAATAAVVGFAFWITGRLAAQRRQSASSLQPPASSQARDT